MKKETSERRENGLNLLSTDLKSMARTLLGKRGFSSVDLLACWEDIVGSQMAVGIRPDKITYPRGKRTEGVLHVKVLGGAFAIMLEHQKKNLLEKVNTFLGYVAVRDIKIIQGNPFETTVLKKEEPQKTLTKEEEMLLRSKVAEIENPQLKEAVYRLGERIFLK